jgi:hypothetical protein
MEWRLPSSLDNRRKYMLDDASKSTARVLRRPYGNIVVRPVSEHRADAGLKPVYQDLKATFGVPWVGVITQAVAHYRPFFIEAWRQFQPSALSHYFESRCDAIRLSAWEQIDSSFEVPALATRLQQIGYSDTELTQIRAILDIFDYGNPKYLVLATAIQQSLCEDRRLGGGTASGRWDRLPRSPIYQLDPIPVMVEEHHALEGLHAIYEDIKLTLGLPFVNSDYKAMGRWPSYLALAWQDLKPCIDSEPYVRIRQEVHEQALATVDGLPHRYFVDKARAIALGMAEDDVFELMRVITLFQWLLSGLILNVTWFKRALAEPAR